MHYVGACACCAACACCCNWHACVLLSRYSVVCSNNDDSEVCTFYLLQCSVCVYCSHFCLLICTSLTILSQSTSACCCLGLPLSEATVMRVKSALSACCSVQSVSVVVICAFYSVQV